MNFRDQQLTCSTCDKEFIWTVTEQRNLHRAGQEIEPPAQCADCRLVDPESGRMTGRVKWFSYEKGYGFIAKPNGDELFFHRSHVTEREQLSTLDEGTPVTFEQVSAERGPEAHDVKVRASE